MSDESTTSSLDQADAGSPVGQAKAAPQASDGAAQSRHRAQAKSARAIRWFLLLCHLSFFVALAALLYARKPSQETVAWVGLAGGGAGVLLGLWLRKWACKGWPVFVSYHHSDSSYAQAVRAALATAGLNCRMITHDLGMGTRDLAKTLRAEVAIASDATVLVDAAGGERSPWVRFELVQALLAGNILVLLVSDSDAADSRVAIPRHARERIEAEGVTVGYFTVNASRMGLEAAAGIASRLVQLTRSRRNGSAVRLMREEAGLRKRRWSSPTRHGTRDVHASFLVGSTQASHRVLQGVWRKYRVAIRRARIQLFRRSVDQVLHEWNGSLASSEDVGSGS